MIQSSKVCEMEELPSETKIKRECITHAVETLQIAYEKMVKPNIQKKPLFDEAENTPIFLQIVLKKVPRKKTVRRINILLKHSLFTDTSEVCFIVGNRETVRIGDSQRTVFSKELFKKEGINSVTEVLSVDTIAKEYKPHEARGKLVSAYDVFLTEKRIASYLPRVLGANFFRKHKFPLEIDTVKKKNLKTQIDTALSKTVLYLTERGNTSSVKVAYLQWTVEKITDNIMCSILRLIERLPGSFENIYSLHIKVHKSPALPIYMSFEPGHNLDVETKPKPEQPEITTLRSTKVLVYPDNRVELRANEGHEPSDSDSDYELKLMKKQENEKEKIHRKRFGKQRHQGEAKKKKTTV